MSESLFVRPDSTGSFFEWAVWSDSQRRVTEAGMQSLTEPAGEIALKVSGRRHTIILPASFYSFQHVSYPKKVRRISPDVLALFCEGRVASDIESFRVSLLSAKGREADLAMIGKEFLKNIFARLADFGINPDRVLIDALLLPLPDDPGPESMSVVRDFSGFLVRSGRFSGTYIDDSWASAFFSGLSDKMHVTVLGEDELPDFRGKVQRKPGLGRLIEYFPGASEKKKGIYQEAPSGKKRSSILKNPMFIEWIPAIVMLLIFMTAGVVSGITGAVRFDRENQFLKSDIAKRAKILFPNMPSSADPMSYLRGQLKHRPVMSSSGFLLSMAEISGIFRGFPDVKVQSISFDETRGFVIHVSAPDYASSERLGNSMPGSYQVSFGDVKKGDKETETDIILRREVQKEGGRR